MRKERKGGKTKKISRKRPTTRNSGELRKSRVTTGVTKKKMIAAARVTKVRNRTEIMGINKDIYAGHVTVSRSSGTWVGLLKILDRIRKFVKRSG